ncbi:pentapeptide repeat-containing protein [Microcoleus sp. OTE_8_concoct_300]|uniref:pentapeptide repeat-containing protein n=1 Tax=Microcoleus sp. OTE_8_concoct_300 TaxID=2964710 RepID=UPI00403FBFFD
MKASQVLQEYKKGRRDFKRVSLRGQSFVKKDLSGANFTKADIRGANFSHATLTGTNFARATAGLQRRWVAVQWVLALLMSALSGILASYSGVFVVATSLSVESLLEKWVLSIFFAIVLIAIFGVIVCHGFTVQAVSLIAVAGAVAVAVAFAVAVGGAGAFAGAVTGAVSGAFALAGAFTFAGAGAVAIAGAGAGARAGAGAVTVVVIVAVTVAGAVAGAVALAFAVAGAVSGAAILLSLYVASRAMKGDEKFAIVRQFAIAFGSLGGTRFYCATLTDANFTAATLKNCNFRDATLTRTCWKYTKKLDRARPGNTLLAQSAVRELLITGKGYQKSYEGANLNGANLTAAELEGANLKRADLSQATLHKANLKNANLTETLAIGTDFTAAYLTGACLQACNFGSNPQLAGVDCQYVFWLETENDKGSRERLPHDPDRVFQPGDFEKLYKKMMNVVQILFRNGIDKEAFIEAFQKLMEEYPDITFDSIKSLERKDNDILMTFQVPETADKGKIERLLQDRYEANLKAARLQGELEAEKRHNQDMKDHLAIILGNPSPGTQITQTYHFMAENQTMNNKIDNNRQGDTYTQSGKFGVGHMSGGEIQSGAKVAGELHETQPKTLAESAVEIQQLLQILDRSYPPDIPADTQAEIDVAVKGIAKNPALKERVISALKSGGIEAVKEITDNSYVNILLAAYEGWQNPE